MSYIESDYFSLERECYLTLNYKIVVSIIPYFTPKVIFWGSLALEQFDC